MTAGDHELSTGNAKLRFRDEGAGPVVLLIHGWTLDLDMWEPQARALTDSFRIIRYDRRGFGLSSGSPSLAGDVADVLALCEHLQLRSMALLGMSQGARVSARVAAACPALVSCIVFDGVPAGILESGEPIESDIPTAKYRTLVRSGRLSEFHREWRNHPLMQLRTTDRPVIELLERILDRYRALDLEASDADAPEAPPPLRPESIRCPALIISGAFDLESRLRSAEELARALPASEQAIIAAAGHMPNLDNPIAYNAALRRFLQRFAA
ncbi:MAG TPA: alpha/beta hydrolase [Steroidobacteraceae bacterium]|nr:alpha/beta hydrolase [Steroidobacteraceae bacterium]